MNLWTKIEWYEIQAICGMRLITHVIYNESISFVCIQKSRKGNKSGCRKDLDLKFGRGQFEKDA